MIGSCSGTFYAFDATDGTVRWRHDTADDGARAEFHGAALVTDDVVVVGADARGDAFLYAFALADGAVRWEHGFPGGVSAAALRHGDHILVVTVSGEILAVEIASGVIGWRVDDPPPEARGRRSLDPALVGSTLVVPWRSGHVDAYDAAKGERLWRRDIDSTILTSSAAADDGAVVGTLDGRLIRLPVDGGEPATASFGGVFYGNLATVDRCLLAFSAVGGPNGRGGFSGPHHLSCFDPATLERRWTFEAEEEWSTPRPTVREGLVVAGRDGWLVALDLGDGSPLWDQPVDGVPRGVTATPDRLLVGTLGGRLFVLPWAEPATPD